MNRFCFLNQSFITLLWLMGLFRYIFFSKNVFLFTICELKHSFLFNNNVKKTFYSNRCQLRKPFFWLTINLPKTYL